MRTLSESTTSTTIDIRQLINDGRWQSRVGSILDIIAILKDIDDRRHFIHTQAIRANMLDVAVNLLRIHEETEGLARDIDKAKGRLNRLYEVSVQDIYNDYQETDDDMGNGKNTHQKVRIQTRRPRKAKKARRVFRGGNHRKKATVSQSK